MQDLDEWFQANEPANPRRLKPLWYSVVHDVALFLGDLITSRTPQLRWVMSEAGRTWLPIGPTPVWVVHEPWPLAGPL